MFKYSNVGICTYVHINIHKYIYFYVTIAIYILYTEMSIYYLIIENVYYMQVYTVHTESEKRERAFHCMILYSWASQFCLLVNNVSVSDLT